MLKISDDAKNQLADQMDSHRSIDEDGDNVMLLGHLG